MGRYSIAIGFGYDYEEAVAFREHTLEVLRGQGYDVCREDIPIYQIGATISVHTGPYPLGVHRGGEAGGHGGHPLSRGLLLLRYKRAPDALHRSPVIVCNIAYL